VIKEREALVSHVRETMKGREPAHDFLHVTRVVVVGERIARAVGADVDVVTTAALLHELRTFPKNDPRSATAGDVCAVAAHALLIERGETAAFATRVAEAISDHAFSKGAAPTTLESAVLQDADRLDAIGAVGIARCFATCADMKAVFYAEKDAFCETRSPDDKAYAVDHFFKKLLKIEARLHTEPAVEMAAGRTAFLRAFLDQLRQEI
jgi:uncharacterized protein